VKKIKDFILNIKDELKKVRWPNVKKMSKYSAITVIFIVFFAVFFYLSDLVIAGIRMLVK